MRPSSSDYPLVFLFAAFVMAAAVEFLWFDWLDTPERRLSDVFVASQANKRAPDADIVIVDVDEASLANLSDYAGRWPWPRSVHGELVAGIAAQAPRAIVFDIMFSEPDSFRPDADAFFNQVVAQTPQIYFPVPRQPTAGDPYGLSLAALAPYLGAVKTATTDENATIDITVPRALAPENWQLGLINFLADRDGTGRRYLVYSDAYGWKLPSLPVRVVQDLGVGIPDVASVSLSWPGGSNAYPHISYADLLADFNREHRVRDAYELKDKIVLIGVSATGLHDIKPTPVNPLHPGVDILATAIDNLKNQNYLREVNQQLPLVATVVLLALLAISFQLRLNTIGIGAALAGISLLSLAAAYAAVGQLLVVPVLRFLVFGWLFYVAAALRDYLRERRARDQAIREFSRFVNPHVVNELMAQGGLSREGESRQVSILFSDIRGFTTLSEKSTPQEVVALLNRYFSRQVDVIFRNNGALDKFIGDAIMAIWGAPLDDDLHATHAVQCALEMVEVLDAFRKDLGRDGEEFDVGIGIHSGPAVVGLIGADRRREYTAIGDSVNLASRIEGLTKGVARILVSEETMRLCGDAFEFVPRGEFQVKGRAQKVRLFEPRRKPS